jgi:hypothetical protein
MPGRTDVSDQSLADFIPPPQSIEDLVKHADVIVVGTVGPIINQGTFSGYDKAGNVIHNKYPDHPNSDLPITDYAIKVEEVLRDDGTIQAGKPLVLRMIGHPTNIAERDAERQSYYPMSYTGDHHLFFLGRNPDGTYGLHYGPWSRLVINGPIVTVSDGPRTPVQFGARQFKATDFIQSVTRAAQQVPANSTPAVTP